MIHPRVSRLCKLVACLVVTTGPASADDACGLVTADEAAAILGAPATATLEANGCVIAASEAQIQLRLDTLAPADVLRFAKHLDEERGDEEPSLHGEPWYEISAADPTRPQSRTMIIYRDRTSLTIDVAGRPDARAALERVWLDIALRLPSDAPPR